jgi:thioredoxin reductase
MSQELLEVVEVAVIGAGATGVGVGVALKDFGIQNFALLERYKIGASFARWPAEMRFITPSFTSNQFGQLDLNSISLQTSPAFTLRKEHLSGKEYARYLRGVASHYELPVWEGNSVKSVTPLERGFEIVTDKGLIQARFVIWAAGEFQYPNLTPFPGAQHCLHNSRVKSWEKLEGKEFIIIGGAESGIDAAVNLAHCGKLALVLDEEPLWEMKSSDPSVVLSPYTAERLRFALESELIQLEADNKVIEVEKTADGYNVITADGGEWPTPQRPILATGFKGSVQLVADLFEMRDEDGLPKLNRFDESTRTPGLFLLGPQVRHDKVIFCFVYKFRQRFAIIANQIAKRMGKENKAAIKQYRKAAMYLDDLSCCKQECEC